MNNKSYTTAFSVDQTPRECFHAIKTLEVGGLKKQKARRINQMKHFSIIIKMFIFLKLRLVEEIPDKNWFMMFWITSLVLQKIKRMARNKTGFEISENNGKTTVKFTHDGLVSEEECYNVCTDAREIILTIVCII